MGRAARLPPLARAISALGRGTLVYLWPLPVLAAIVVSQRGSPAAWLVTVLSLVTLWPASLVAGELWGARAGGIASLVGAILAGGWLLPVRPAPVAPPFTLEQRFSRADQALKHVIRPPRETAQWQRVWHGTPEPEASLWLLLARDGEISGHLAVTLNGLPLAALGPSTTAPTAGGTQSAEREWHRLRVSRATVDAAPALEVGVRPDPTTPPDRRVAVLGGFSYRPTGGPGASAFFDGISWSSAPDRLFDLSLPRNLSVRPRDLAGSFRYYVELRLIDSATRRVRAIYY